MTDAEQSGELPNAAELGRRSLEAPQQALFDALPLAEREALLDAVKADLDAQVRAAPAEALAISERLVELAEKTPSRAALAIRGRATAHHANGLSAEAARDYERARELYAEAGERLEVARVERSLVDALQMSGRAGEALEVGARARATLQELGEVRLLAQLLCNLGNVYFRLDRFREAEQSYREADELFRSLEDETGRGFALYNLGNVETNAHRFDAAEEAFDQAEALFRKADLRVLQADCRYGRAYLDFRRGRFREAERALLSVREEFSELGKPGGRALCDLDLAELYLKLDSNHDALSKARAAGADLEGLTLPHERARSHFLAGVARIRLGQEPESAADLGRAVAIWNELGNRTQSALVDIHRVLLTLEGRVELGGERKEILERALGDLRSSGDRFLTDVGVLALARLELHEGENEAALRLLSELTQAPRDAAPLHRVLALEAWTLRGFALRADGDLELAEAALLEAVRLCEATYQSLDRADSRLAFIREHHNAYTSAAALALVRRGAADESVELVERARQRSLAERPERATTAALADARARLDTLLARFLDGRIGRLKDGSDPRVRGELLAEDAELDLAQDAYMKLLRESRGPAADPAPASAELRSARAALPPDEGLAYFLIDGDEVWLVHGDSASLTADRLPMGRAEIQATAARLRFQLEKFRLGREYVQRHEHALRASTDAILRELGAGLLAPLERTQPAGRPLRLVPFGPLHDLPLHAFELGGLPLIERHPTSYARSLRQLALTRARSPRGTDVWACGDSAHGLPAIERELGALRSTYGQDLREPGVDAILEVAGRGEIDRPIAALHLAAHGGFQPTHPLFSGLLFGERFLGALDLERLPLDGAIVSLSGCETGRCKPSRADEVFGPENSLILAGASAVVSSLWSVDDACTAECMRLLHAEMARGTDVRAALRAAQTELRSRDLHPFAWGAFVVCGNPAAALSRQA